MAAEHKKKHKKQYHSGKKGLPPGTHIYTGKNKIEIPVIDIISYDETSCETSHPNLSQTIERKPTAKKEWININGISDESYVRLICDKYGIHTLFQEDILNVFQRPKVEEDSKYLFMTFKSLNWNEENRCLDEEQLSFILLDKTVLSFQEIPGDQFDQIRTRLNTDGSIIRTKEVDYLFYRLLDVTVDNYFEILEKLGDYLEEIEDGIMHHPTAQDLEKIQENKKDIMQLRKHIYPLRDVLNRIISTENDLIDEKTKKYFKDVLDHTIQVLETVETYREINLSLKDVYLNSLSHEMNRVMKVLTIISTVFIPLTFIVGVYGMNFDNMPELRWQYGYFYIWGFMIVVTLLLIVWFRNKRWF